MVRERVHRMSVSDYHRAGEMGMLGEDVELLRGIVFKKMPKSPLHELVSQKLMLVLLAQVPKELNGSGRDVEVSQQSHGASELRSLASQAPYLAAWKTSSSSSSGYSRTMSFAV